ncbi:toll/interleukin-1 receptor domain-containing protein [Frateuria terrea]|uniref:TIR domain-containing protein n=1 Tax=Frateuria terrea TaxID=529704 RepID=A0A1H6SSU9_9GAMM|nr:toll/interleukin-1 receptor domain-containing protein [Frateuria terrea]SEI67857.1 TIR domain-containing protein [Frateuria terrea]SFP26823.1 TIR domain-containing protein [Frateuria terrea]
MARYITRDQLRSFATELGLVEATRIRRAAASRALAGSTFLSHSSKDDELVAGAIRVLENHGAKVYVDEIDPEMPPYTSEETAALLKARIRDSSRFVLLASKNSKESKWVPWELGIADGAKTPSKIALFPASDSSFDQSWASWEYLGLYNRIAWGKLEGYQREVWMVIDENRNIGVELSKWLSGY